MKILKTLGVIATFLSILAFWGICLYFSYSSKKEHQWKIYDAATVCERHRNVANGVNNAPSYERGFEKCPLIVLERDNYETEKHQNEMTWDQSIVNRALEGVK